MGAKNTQFNTRGPFLGEYVSGKYVGYHSQQLSEPSVGGAFSATGGTTSTYGAYKVHIFTASGAFVVVPSF